MTESPSVFTSGALIECEPGANVLHLGRAVTLCIQNALEFIFVAHIKIVVQYSRFGQSPSSHATQENS